MDPSEPQRDTQHVSTRRRACIRCAVTTRARCYVHTYMSSLPRREGQGKRARLCANCIGRFRASRLLDIAKRQAIPNPPPPPPPSTLGQVPPNTTIAPQTRACSTRRLLTLSISLSSLCSLRRLLLHSPVAIATCVCRCSLCPSPVPLFPPRVRARCSL